MSLPEPVTKVDHGRGVLLATPSDATWQSVSAELERQDVPVEFANEDVHDVMARLDTGLWS
ncbi:MAG: hypothetical protein GY851_19680, partial [bacterium]|nr:hypothetical protein [bacterium]